jgi:hypothetical protein
MAGKSATMNLVDHQNKWRENSTARATTEVKEMAGKSATIHMDQLKQKKMAGKYYDTCVEGGKWRENSKPVEAKKWRE